MPHARIRISTSPVPGTGAARSSNAILSFGFLKISGSHSRAASPGRWAIVYRRSSDANVKRMSVARGASGDGKNVLHTGISRCPAPPGSERCPKPRISKANSAETECLHCLQVPKGAANVPASENTVFAPKIPDYSFLSAMCYRRSRFADSSVTAGYQPIECCIERIECCIEVHTSLLAAVLDFHVVQLILSPIRATSPPLLRQCRPSLPPNGYTTR
jgi:hypothetical protein